MIIIRNNNAKFTISSIVAKNTMGVSYMAELISKIPRICYEGGNPVTGKKIYEFQLFCTCTDCLHRKAWRKEPRNIATITVKDTSKKVDGLAEFIKNWICEDGKQHLKAAYFQF